LADDTFARRAANHPGAAPTYTIFLRDFTAPVAIRGAAERRPARFNVRLTVAHPGPGFPDDIAAVMSYEDIVEDLRRLCAGPAVPGPEHLAEQAAALCLERAKVRKVRVEVELGAGNGTGDAAAGVTITRERP
jgi:dihydroneopterin aldolase